MTTDLDWATLTRPPVELAQGASIFLDFDGTLVDLTSAPDRVVVDDRLRELLSRLNRRLAGRLAILSGRAATDVAALIAPAQAIIGGSHGLELHGVRGEAAAERPHALDAIAADFAHLKQRFPGVIIEEKPLGIALHYRQAPDAEDACRDAAHLAAQRSGLELQPGKMVFELRPAGANKGDALRLLMERPPFAGSRPLFLGDDLTDEPGFARARELGGAGVLVGEARQTAATYRLAGVAEALDWLAMAAEQEG